MSERFYAYINRTMCDVLGEMRKCHETRNYAYLPGLIEEVQVMGNRMEAALGEKRDIEEWHKQWQKKKAEMKKMYKELDKLKQQKEVVDGDNS